MNIIDAKPKPVWEVYPGYSFTVQLYHSFDMYKADYEDFSKQELETVAGHVRLAHMLVMARMDEEDYQDLLRSVSDCSAEERAQIKHDWGYVCNVFDEEFLMQVKENMKHAGN